MNPKAIGTLQYIKEDILITQGINCFVSGCIADLTTVSAVLSLFASEIVICNFLDPV
jgi:hypothetical protein